MICATSSRFLIPSYSSHFSPDALLNWFRKQLASYDCLAVNDMTYSFQDGLALCAIIHR